MDVDAVLARRPAAWPSSTSWPTPTCPGSRNEKRWQDVDELLDAGIDVISTVNIQHLESLNDVVERITGVQPAGDGARRASCAAAEQVELVDMTPEALRRRMAHGNIYPAEQIDAALGNYFRPGNLGALRELALLWVADRVDDALQDYLRATTASPDAWETRERVLVALTGAPGSEHLIRRAARIGPAAPAATSSACTSRRPTAWPSSVGAALAEHRRLLEELGGTYREVVGDDVAATLVAVARTEHATQIVLGASRRTRRQRADRAAR